MSDNTKKWIYSWVVGLLSGIFIAFGPKLIILISSIPVEIVMFFVIALVVTFLIRILIEPE